MNFKKIIFCLLSAFILNIVMGCVSFQKELSYTAFDVDDGSEATETYTNIVQVISFNNLDTINEEETLLDMQGDVAKQNIIVEKNRETAFEEKVAIEGLNGYLSMLYGESYNVEKDLELNIHGRITFLNDKYISYYFQGLGNVISAAHPNNLSYGVIVDRENQQIIQPADIMEPEKLVVEINGELIERFGINSSDEMVLFTANDFGSKESSFISSCILDDKFVIIVPVPHVIGDYALINISTVAKSN